MKAARLHSYDESIPKDSLEVEEIDEPRIEAPLDVIVRVGRRRALPDGHPRHRGPVGAHTGPGRHAATVRARARELGLGRGGGLGGHQRPAGDTVICHPLMTCGLVPLLPRRRDMHCENGAFPGISQRRRLRRAPEDQRPRGGQARPRPRAQGHRGPRRRGPHGPPRRQEVRPRTLYAGTNAVVIGAGGLGHIGIQCLRAMTPTEIIVVDPSEEALELAREWGADETVKVEEGLRGHRVEMTNGGAEVVFDYVGERGARG